MPPRFWRQHKRRDVFGIRDGAPLHLKARYSLNGFIARATVFC
jgi:hypothetical protein